MGACGGGGGGGCITLHIFLLYPFSAERCMTACTLTVIHVPNPRRGLSGVLCIMKVDISPHVSRAMSVVAVCCS